MIQYKTITFTHAGCSVRVSGWFLFNRWALLRYEFLEEGAPDANTDEDLSA